MVEFFGLPGAGKTTLVDDLPVAENTSRREDLARALRSLPNLKVARLVLRAMFDLPWLFALIALALKTPIWRLESLRRMLRIAATKNWIASQKGPLVLDQGSLQGLWSIFYTEGIALPPRKELVRVLRFLYSDVRLVVIEILVDPSIAAERVSARVRGSSRLDELPARVVQDKLEVLESLPGELLAAAREAGFEVHSLSGRSDLADLRVKVADLLMRIERPLISLCD